MSCAYGGGTTSRMAGRSRFGMDAFDCNRRFVFRISLRVHVRDLLRPSLVRSVPMNCEICQHTLSAKAGVRPTSGGLCRVAFMVIARVISDWRSKKPLTRSRSNDSVSTQFVQWGCHDRCCAGFSGGGWAGLVAVDFEDLMV
jgi:hypothetical protein